MSVVDEIKEIKRFAVGMKGKAPNYILLSPFKDKQLRMEVDELSAGLDAEGMFVGNFFMGMRVIVAPFAGTHFLELGYD